MEFPEFLKRKIDRTEDAANKRGQGFRFLNVPGRNDINAIIRSRRGRIALLTTSATLAIFIVVTQITRDNAFMMLALLGVGALLVYDIISRRAWENTLTTQLRTLTQNHDRLVREVARTRADVSILKEGLYDTANAVHDIGRHNIPTNSVEARMIETIINQLSLLGQKPRPQIKPGTPDAPAAPAPDPMDEILQLEVSPPPRLPATNSELEVALGPNFDRFSDTVILELVRHAVRHDHLDVFAQPIVSLPQRKMRMYEVFARLRANAGAYIPAGRYLQVAERESLVPAIDNLLLLRCLQILRDRRDEPMDVPYILNITTGTLNDTGFMNDLITFLAQNRRLAGRLIFELPLEDVEAASKTLKELLDGLSRLGCRFSVDQVRKRRIDINMLKSHHVRFLKLDAAWLLREAKQDGGPARIIKLKKQMDKSGLDLIAEKVERDAQLRELLDYGIDYAQGYLFGKPDLHAVYHAREKRETYG